MDNLKKVNKKQLAMLADSLPKGKDRTALLAFLAWLEEQETKEVKNSIEEVNQKLEALFFLVEKSAKKKSVKKAINSVSSSFSLEVEKLKQDVQSLISETKDWLEKNKPENGKDYVLTDENVSFIVSEVLDQVSDGADGEDGYTPVKGVDYYTPAERQEIILETALSVESQIAPMVIEETSPTVIKNKIQSLEEEGWLDAKAIKNLPQAKVSSGGARGVNINNGSGQSYLASDITFTGATVTRDGRKVTVSVPSGDQEQIEDIVGAMIVAGSNIDSVTYDDSTGTITINATDQTAGLATVATTGDYGDLSGTPTIPTVSNTAYDASWDGNTDAPTKNAIYDKIESLGTGISTNTRANILAIASPTAGETWYATDIKRFYLYTGTGWVSSGTPFYADEVTSTNPDTTPIESRVSGYLEDVIYGKVLSYCGAKGLILSKDQVDTDGALGRSDEGRPTIYFDGEHKEFLIGVRIEKDGGEGGLPELQVTKGDNTEWVDLHNGDSDSLDANGLPIIHGWMEDFGVEAHHTIIDPN